MADTMSCIEEALYNMVDTMSCFKEVLISGVPTRPILSHDTKEIVVFLQ